ncbi:hypothetical protein DL98DRAFT_598198 [Cadophora sp. DSE1049]|nr:hypothetical protein DL98DRAFT_598198 [Cadophora sp. DSE1049]
MQQSPGASKIGGPGRKTKGSQRPSRDDRMLKGVDNLIRNIYVETPEAQKEAPKAVTINKYEPIASYSWKDIEHPTIYVPGIFPLPLGAKGPRSPAAAVDPLFQTLLHQHPEFDMSPIQLVTDRNSLRNFLSFASKGPGKWRIDVDMINNTMFLNQWEEFRLMMINGHQDSGFGHAFEKSITTRESGLDAIHHERIVRYELGGLDCLVRFEADAYLNANGNTESEDRVAIPSSDPPAPKPSRPVLKPPYKLVHVVSSGHDIDPALIAEIKSCSTRKFNISKALPQLWFSQTKHLCVGYHKDGLVTEKLEMKDMTEELQKWEASSQEHLKTMIRIIEEIREIAKTARRCVVVCNMVDGVKCLSVFGRKGSDMAIHLLLIQHNWASDEPLSTRHSIPLSTAPDVIRPDRQVIAIKSLLLELKTAINATTPLSYPYIYLSYPDTVAKRSTHCGRFDTVAEEGGFGIMRAGGSSRLALYEHGTRSCCDGEDEDQSCVDEQCDPGVKVVLAVSLMEENLETVVLTRTHGLWAMWGSPRTAIDVHLGLGSSEYARKEPYWREVKEAIAKNVRTDRIDRVMLLSEHWESQDLRKAVQEALGGTARDRTPDARLFEEPIFAYEQRCVVCCSWKRDGCERGVVGSS